MGRKALQSTPENIGDLKLYFNKIIETGTTNCQSGTFWFTPANTKNGPHKAITDVDILTIRLGEIGVFENN